MLSVQAWAVLACVPISFGVLSRAVILRSVMKSKRKDTATATRRPNKRKRKRLAKTDDRQGRYNCHGPEENDDDGPYNLHGRLFR